MNTLQAVMELGVKNLKRWWGRLTVIAVLVMLTTTLSVFYQSMLINERWQLTEEVSRLALPYDLLVKLPKSLSPLPVEQLPKPLDSKQMERIVRSWEQNQIKERIYEVPSVPQSFVYAESAAGGMVETSFGNWDVLGVNPDSVFYKEYIPTSLGNWLNARREIVLPKSLAEENQLELGEVITLRAYTDTQLRVERDFTIVGVFDMDYDLPQPLILVEDAMELFTLATPNRQLLLIDELSRHATGLERNMNVVYPGASYVYEWIGQTRMLQLTKAVQSPSTWVLLLIYLFMSFGVLTLSLITFLERRKELAILKSIGAENSMIVILLAMEYAIAAFIGLISSYIVLRILIPRFNWYQNLPSGTLERLGLQNMLVTVFALTLSLLYPILLAKLASVNQLVFKRKIPLIVERWDYINKPKYEHLLLEKTRNVRVLQLENEDGKLFGSFLRKPGEHVKKGEVLFIQEKLSGFVYKEWISPCDGLLDFESYSGMLIITPDQPDELGHHYSPRILEEFERRQAGVLKVKGQVRHEDHS
jgi:ABC-type lipoprotein release transport system permease subunit